ncbi:hypothetical protein KOM00_06655 [Geomonas sp. Red69]|uniref:Uncharacterized protein n=1 Tax=Geomonas diazotrophica TaxID=2843197 RepID=A0ABX8JL41_9BACT|nr:MULTISPECIES: hypothetical protein [Geomonas]MBU5636412.1 hypothetical protein [Geomonas diazotrophica]QWV99094.1 hypothetical protein KP005_07385 [Geomonas nitrogeniifigens]QXE88262.1 hypothetical protein KP003_07635 [Geomonas nitrogeniifigens]
MGVQRRIKRDYRRLTPTKFHALVLKVKHCLTGNSIFSDDFWGANIFIRQLFFEKAALYDAAYRAASNGDRALIRERDKIMEELVVILEEIAPLLEAASIRNPDALFTTGFTVTQERRSHTRVKLPLVSPNDLNVVNTAEQGRAVATASTMPGAFNHEIQINRGNPSVEADWFHKSIFPDASNMNLENLEAGNTFFRMRHHGSDGPGPWSPTVSVTIT